MITVLLVKGVILAFFKVRQSTSCLGVVCIVVNETSVMHSGCRYL